MIQRVAYMLLGLALGYAWCLAGRVFVLVVPCEDMIEEPAEDAPADAPADTGVWL